MSKTCIDPNCEHANPSMCITVNKHMFYAVEVELEDGIYTMYVSHEAVGGEPIPDYDAIMLAHNADPTNENNPDLADCFERLERLFDNITSWETVELEV